MENDIAMAATGYVLARVAMLAAFGYLFYRVLRQPARSRVRIETQSNYANERQTSARSKR